MSIVLFLEWQEVFSVSLDKEKERMDLEVSKRSK